MKAQVTTLDNQSAGNIDLDDAVFGIAPRSDILQRVVTWQLAKRRTGAHKTKTISELHGSTRKLSRQKGTGRARHATARAPQFRGGVAAFGPVLRLHGFPLPKKIRKLGLRMALSSKQAEGKLAILDAAQLDAPKTKALVGKVDVLGWRSALIIDVPDIDSNLRRAAANLPGIDLLPEQGANVYDILRCEVLALTRAAVERLEARLK